MRGIEDISGQNKLCLIRILYTKNINEECSSGYKASARDVLSVF